MTLLPSPSLVAGMATSWFSDKRCTFVTVQSRRADLERLAGWIASGELDPSVERVYPLDEIVEALAALASGEVRGKIAVRVVGDPAAG